MELVPRVVPQAEQRAVALAAREAKLVTTKKLHAELAVQINKEQAAVKISSCLWRPIDRLLSWRIPRLPKKLGY